MSLAGVGQPSNYLYDTFVAQGFSKLNVCLARSVTPEFPHYRSWLTHFVLNSTLRANVPAAQRPLAYAILRRAEGAVEDFDEACAALGEFVTEKRTTSGYFRVLRKIESVIAQVHQALDFVRDATGLDFFKKNDGTHYQRLNQVYNVGRHEKPGDLAPGHVQLTWLENDGVHVPSAVLTFEELRALVAELAGLAAKIAACHPWIPAGKGAGTATPP